jgi:hypothetical protein
MTRGLNVVIFGPDNSGKTTLATTIEKDLGFVQKHSPGPVSPEKMVEFMVDNISSIENIVYDRFPAIEEATCGVVLRGINKLSDQRKIVDRILSKVDLFVMCMPPVGVITKWGDREQMEGIKENINELISAYKDLFSELRDKGYPVYYYDWTQGEDKLIGIKERIKKI